MSFGNRLFSSLRAQRSGVEKQNAGPRTESFLHCPFCQGKSIMIRKKKTSENEDSYQAKCKACGALGPPGSNPSEAKEFWNERITDAESAAS